MISMESLGWNEFFINELKKLNNPEFKPARISVEHKERYEVISEFGEAAAEVSGKMMFNAVSISDYPKAGDWVAGIYFSDEKKLIIHEVLKRKSVFSRNMAGRKNEEQVIAANLDYLFIMQSMDNDYSPRRMQRYLAAAIQGNVKPVIILSKSDLADNPEKRVQEMNQMSPGIPVHSVSSVSGNGLNIIQEYCMPGVTVAIAGSSGVGKSTLINVLSGNQIQKVQEVRQADSKGRHTTTRRELFILPGGGIIIDTPGMREFQMWDADEGLQSAFNEIDILAGECRYSDCRHISEKGCAVLEALDNGSLLPERYHSYIKLLKEQEYLNRRTDIDAYLEEKRKWKNIHKEVKRFNKLNLKNKF